MTDKKLIRQEIERRIDLYSIAEKDDSTFARMGELSSLIDFIDSLPKEPASEDLEEEIENYIKDSLAIKFPTTDKEQIKADIRYIAHHFAEWQKQKDQETIELAEDHAMLAGMNKMKEEMMENAVYGYVALCHDYPYRRSLVAIADGLINFEYAEKVKIIIVKEE